MPSVAASTQQQYVLVRNGEAQPCSVNSKTWLQTAPRGAYTTARTVQSTRVFKFTSHVERLATSANLMAANDAEASGRHIAHCAAAFTAEQLRPKVLTSMRAAVSSFH
eukprot:jgi/Chrzof1/14862/Cz09g18240.t1